MMGKLGGYKSPRLPEEVNKPSENLSGYFPFIKEGKSKPPKAMIVTPEAPIKAVKMAHENNATMANPPGIHPRKARDTFTNRLGALLSDKIYPEV